MVVQDSKVLMYGGLMGEDSNTQVFMLDLNRNHWSTVALKGDAIAPRDDHAIAELGQDSFVTFGGFVNGARVNEVCKFTFDGAALQGEILSDADAQVQPRVRSSMSIGVKNNCLYSFGG